MLQFKKQERINILNKDYRHFISSYEEDILGHYFSEVPFISIPCTLAKHPDLTLKVRTRLIDWMLHCTLVLHMTDKNIFFTAVEMVDRFYSKVAQSKNK